MLKICITSDPYAARFCKGGPARGEAAAHGPLQWWSVSGGAHPLISQGGALREYFTYSMPTWPSLLASVAISSQIYFTISPYSPSPPRSSLAPVSVSLRKPLTPTLFKKTVFKVLYGSGLFNYFSGKNELFWLKHRISH